MSGLICLIRESCCVIIVCISSLAFQCKSGASSELMGNVEECERYYEMSQIIFKGLLQQCRSVNDKQQLLQCIFSKRKLINKIK